MKATVAQGVATRPILMPTQAEDQGPSDAEEWANREARMLFAQMRQALNRVYAVEATVATTGDGSWTTIYASEDIPDNSQWAVEWWVQGLGTPGAGAGLGHRGAAVFGRLAGGSAGALGTASLYMIRNPVGYNVQAVASGNGFVLQVKDDGVTPAMWRAQVSLFQEPL